MNISAALQTYTCTATQKDKVEEKEVSPCHKTVLPSSQPPCKAPLETQESPYQFPGENGILIQKRAIGINQINRKIQDFEFVPFRYPGVLATKAPVRSWQSEATIHAFASASES